jgi:hypothetical protein
MKKIYSICFTLVLGFSAMTWASTPEAEESIAPEWILDLETGETIDDGDYWGVWVCGDTCTYYPLPIA